MSRVQQFLSVFVSVLLWPMVLFVMVSVLARFILECEDFEA